jgi:hypothetical protein
MTVPVVGWALARFKIVEINLLMRRFISSKRKCSTIIAGLFG